MTRTDSDTWDITESVGATALGVCAARAVETQREDRLFTDPLAQLFVDAAGEGSWGMFTRDAMPDELVEADPDLPRRVQTLMDYIASRTAFFDEFFVAATQSGIRQVVILAAGLDTRAWRLPWPDGAIVYELDLPKVLEFKAATLGQNDAQPVANQVGVPVDLRHDWPEVLRQAGFDPAARTAWLAEGLLPFLPAAAQDLLFERVQQLSAPGSRIAVEAFGDEFLDPDRLARHRERLERLRAVRAAPHAMPDVTDLWYLEDRADVADWLGHHGWETSTVTADELLTRYDRDVPRDLDDATPMSRFVCAQR